MIPGLQEKHIMTYYANNHLTINTSTKVILIIYSSELRSALKYDYLNYTNVHINELLREKPQAPACSKG